MPRFSGSRGPTSFLMGKPRDGVHHQPTHVPPRILSSGRLGPRHTSRRGLRRGSRGIVLGPDRPSAMPCVSCSQLYLFLFCCCWAKLRRPPKPSRARSNGAIRQRLQRLQLRLLEHALHASQHKSNRPAANLRRWGPLLSDGRHVMSAIIQPPNRRFPVSALGAHALSRSFWAILEARSSRGTAARLVRTPHPDSGTRPHPTDQGRAG